jgi:hypothetical protein
MRSRRVIQVIVAASLLVGFICIWHKKETGLHDQLVEDVTLFFKSHGVVPSSAGELAAFERKRGLKPVALAFRQLQIEETPPGWITIDSLRGYVFKSIRHHEYYAGRQHSIRYRASEPGGRPPSRP